jgi:hypothetical protein
LDGPNALLDVVQDFLCLDRRLRVERSYIAPEATSYFDYPSPDVLSSMHDLYAVDIQQTARLSGLVLDDWLMPDYTEPMRPD